MTEKISIMTSSDENLVEHIFVQLKSISTFFQNRYVDFYLFSTKISDEWIEKLEKYCFYLKNVKFHHIYIYIYIEELEKVRKFGGRWPTEAYYSLLAHYLLPEELDRILYIDAGDVIFWGDNRNIDEFYDCDFDGNLLHVTSGRFKQVQGEVVHYESNDLVTPHHLKSIARGLFNSGSYMINLEGFRKKSIDIHNLVNLAEVISKIVKNQEESYFGNDGTCYFGDQGFLSIAFIGQIKYIPSTNVWDMPYNFCVWFFDRGLQQFGKLWYEPYIVHFAGGEKPWNINSLTSPKIKKGQLPFYEKWKSIERTVTKDLSNLGISL